MINKNNNYNIIITFYEFWANKKKTKNKKIPFTYPFSGHKIERWQGRIAYTASTQQGEKTSCESVRGWRPVEVGVGGEEKWRRRAKRRWFPFVSCGRFIIVLSTLFCFFLYRFVSGVWRSIDSVLCGYLISRLSYLDLLRNKDIRI